MPQETNIQKIAKGMTQKAHEFQIKKFASQPVDHLVTKIDPVI